METYELVFPHPNGSVRVIPFEAADDAAARRRLAEAACGAATPIRVRVVAPDGSRRSLAATGPRPRCSTTPPRRSINAGFRARVPAPAEFVDLTGASPAEIETAIRRHPFARRS